MNNRRDLLSRIRRLTRPEWLLLFEACWSLVWAWVVLRFMPFKRIAVDLGEAKNTAPQEEEISDTQPIVHKIIWATRAAARRMPGISTCLVRALAARRMLDRRELPSVLHFGLKKDGDGRLQAHAWLCSGQQALTGAGERHQFTLISTFIKQKGSQNARTE